MTKNQILRCILFLLLLCMALYVLCDLFEQENSLNHDQRFHQYRSFPENTVDAVYIGTSGVDRYWIASKAYDEYGMTVYPLSADGMPAWLYTNMIEEAYTYQNPQLLLLDIRPFTYTEDPQNSHAEIVSAWDVKARRTLDAMDFTSVNRFKAACKTMEVIHSLDESKPRFDISYFLPFIRYHDKWTEDTFRFSTNLGQRTHANMGFYYDDWFSVFSHSLRLFVLSSAHTQPLDPVSEASLRELLDYIREKELNVLFVDSPQVLLPRDAGLTNRVYQILEEEGFECLHFYNQDDAYPFAIPLNLRTDFYGRSHVNYYGAEKYTAALAAYLDEHYDLPDRRRDPAVSEIWDGAYDSLLENISAITAAP